MTIFALLLWLGRDAAAAVAAETPVSVEGSNINDGETIGIIVGCIVALLLLIVLVIIIILLYRRRRRRQRKYNSAKTLLTLRSYLFTYVHNDLYTLLLARNESDETNAQN